MSDKHKDLVATARKAGIWYLVLAISGVLGFLVLHPQIYVSNDLPKTLANLQEQETIARLRLLAEFVIIVSQALAAVYFFKLFKDIIHFACLKNLNFIIAQLKLAQWHSHAGAWEREYKLHTLVLPRGNASFM
jgi:hypothetical protein